jgi:hypothetical protein
VLPIAAALRPTGYRIPPINAQQTEATMPDSEQQQAAPSATGKGADEIVARHSRTVKQATAAGVRAEAARRGDIAAVFGDFYDADPLNPITALHDECMEDTACDELAARRKLLDFLAHKSAEPIIAREHYATAPQPSAPPRASRHLGGPMLAGPDQSEKRAKGLQSALSIKAGLVTDRAVIDQERRGEFLSMSLIDIMGQELRASGYPVAGSREDIARR